MNSRLDLMHGDILAQITAAKKETNLPVIATLRSAEEGGNYFGNADEWFNRIEQNPSTSGIYRY